MNATQCPKCSEAATFPFFKKRGKFVCSECEAEFDEAPKPPIDPQTIFLSYAHKSEREVDFDVSEELVLLIKAELDKDGHTVWIDKEGIRSGSQWRERITDAILANTFFLSFLSRRSVRDPGVCLNEISIALGSSRNIQTVLAEQERSVAPPLTISHLQWHDFQDWRAIREGAKTGPNGEKWNEWFDQRSLLVREAIANAKNARITGELTRLREILDPRSFESRIAEKTDGFFGRAWLFDAASIWLDESTSRLLWLKAGPGIGKSAFAAKLAHRERSAVIGFFMCDFQGKKDPEESAREAICTLAYQIASRLPDYRLKLLHQQGVDKEKILRKSADDLFEYLITEPLNSAGKIPEAKRLALVIDGLDEAGRNDGTNSLAELLQKHVHKLPDWLGIIVTSRPEPYLEQILAGFQTTVLEGQSDQNQQDLHDFIQAKLPQDLPNKEQICRAVLAKSGGTFLYLRLLESDKYIDITRPETLPDKLDGFFKQTFSRYFQERVNYDGEIEPFLRLMVAAPGAVPKQLGCDILGWGQRDLQTKIIEPLGSLLVERHGSLTLFHASLSDWLKDPRRSGAHCVNLTGAKEIGDFLWSEYLKFPDGEWQKIICEWLPLLISDTSHWFEPDQLEEFSNFLQGQQILRCAVPLREQHLTLTKKHFGEESIEHARSLFNFALLKRKLGQFVTAQESLEKSTAIQSRLGLHSSDFYAETIDELGVAVKEQAKLGPASSLFRQALAIRERNGSVNRFGIASSLNRLGEIEDSKGNFREALAEYTRCLAIYSEVGANQSTQCAALMNNLAIVTLRVNGGLIFGQGNPFTMVSAEFSQAEVLLRQSAEIYRHANNGQTGSDEATVLNNLGLALQNSGKFELAQAAFSKSREICTNLFGGDHHSVATNLNNLAVLLDSAGRSEQAEESYLKSLSIYESALGRTHPHVARCLNNYGVLLHTVGRVQDSREHYQRALKIFLDSLGENHCDTAQVQSNLALLMCSDEAGEDSLSLLERALNTRVNSLGANHPQTGNSHIHLARMLLRLGRNEASCEHFSSGISIVRHWLGKGSPSLVPVLKQYGIALLAHGLNQQSAEVDREGREIEHLSRADCGLDGDSDEFGEEKLVELPRIEDLRTRAGTESVLRMQLEVADVGFSHPITK
jgi:tetratricopeptide (TPR) repeat protein